MKNINARFLILLTLLSTLTLLPQASADPPVLSLDPPHLELTTGMNARFEVTATGGNQLTYQWNLYGDPINGANSPLLEIQNVNPGHAGIYSVDVSNPRGDTSTASATLLVQQRPSPQGPILVCPPNSTLTTSSSLGLPVHFFPTIANPPQPGAQYQCHPPSGTLFPLGTTLVDCYASASSSVTNTASFSITVELRSPSTNNTHQIVVHAPDAGPQNEPVFLGGAHFSELVKTNFTEWNDDDHFRTGTVRLDLPAEWPEVTHLLFPVGQLNQNEDGLLNLEPVSSGWEMAYISLKNDHDHPLDAGTPILFSAESEPVELLRVPLDSPGLVAGQVIASIGDVVDRTGEFTLSRIDVGTYELRMPTKNPLNGQLLLNAAGSSDDPTLPFGTLITHSFNNGLYHIETRAALPGRDGFNPQAPLRDVNFAFAWLDQVNPNATHPSPAPSSISVRMVGDSVEVSWPETASGFELESSDDINGSRWNPVQQTPLLNGGLLTVSLPYKLNAAQFFRLVHKGPENCPNGNLEEGHLGGFVGGTATTYGPWSTGIVSGRHTVMSDPAAYDTIVGGTIMPQVREGDYSVRLGNTSGGEKEFLSYTFVVDESNKHFSFSYAVVMQDPPAHGPDEKPYFAYSIYPKSTPWSPIKTVKKIADSSDPYFTPGSGDVLYRNWDCEYAYLGSYIGQELTITFVTRDCSLGAHYCYAYIDALCTSPDDSLNPEFTLPSKVCVDDPIFADGTATEGETDHFWSIMESVGWTGVPGTEVFQWFPYTEAGPIDLKAFYATFGGAFDCGKTYRIKLAIKNNCVGWKEKVRLITITCPTADAGPDKVFCNAPTTTETVTIGTPGIGGYTYSWSPTNGLDNPNIAQPEATFTHVQTECDYSTTYTLTVTDSTGCTATDQMTIHSVMPPQIQIMAMKNIDCCDNKVTLIVRNKCGKHFPPGTTIVWSRFNGILGTMKWGNPFTCIPSETVSLTNTVTVTTPCGTATASFVVEPEPAPPSGWLTSSRFAFPGAITLSDPDPTWSKFWVRDNTLECGEPNAYDATAYVLKVYNKYGDLVAQKSGVGCGFENCSIPLWDGKATKTVFYSPFSGRLPYVAGHPVWPGTYRIRFYLKNCEYGWMQVLPYVALKVYP